MKTICMLAKRMISLLESVHNKGVVYRDIKPENFVVGNGNVAFNAMLNI